jgi:hypothetical protein
MENLRFANPLPAPCLTKQARIMETISQAHTEKRPIVAINLPIENLVYQGPSRLVRPDATCARPTGVPKPVHCHSSQMKPERSHMYICPVDISQLATRVEAKMPRPIRGIFPLFKQTRKMQ